MYRDKTVNGFKGFMLLKKIAFVYAQELFCSSSVGHKMTSGQP